MTIWQILSIIFVMTCVLSLLRCCVVIITKCSEIQRQIVELMEAIEQRSRSR